MIVSIDEFNNVIIDSLNYDEKFYLSFFKEVISKPSFYVGTFSKCTLKKEFMNKLYKRNVYKK